MNVLLITSLYAEYGKGGTERMVQLTAESLADAGHRSVVVTAAREPGIRKETLRGVTVYHVGLRNLYWPFTAARPHAVMKSLWHLVNSYNPWMARAVKGIIEQERPDVVNTHSLVGFSCAVWPVSHALGVPICHTLHDHALMCPNAVMYRKGANCDRQCGVCRAYTTPAKRLSALVHGVIGVSDYILQRHLDAGYFPHAPIQRVIYNACSRRPSAGIAVPVDGAGVRFGFVGRLIPGKGAETVLDSFRRCMGSGATLLIAGDGDPDYVNHLKATYEGPGVKFIGHVAPRLAYEQIDVLVAPSLFREALGMVVLEAYQYGIPVIVADRGGLPEMVETGLTGYVFNGDDAASLVGLMKRFVQDKHLAERMRPHVLRKAVSYTAARYYQDYLKVLQQTAEASQPVSAPAGTSAMS